MKRLSRNTILIGSVVVVLVVVVALLGVLNYQSTMRENASSDERSFTILAAKDKQTVRAQDLEALGLTQFSAILDTSTTSPKQVSYSGVSLKRVLEERRIPYSRESRFIARAKDGYTTAYSYKDVVEDDAVYVALEQGGKKLASREQGGMGPFLVVTTNDQFSQRWCKYLSSIEIK